MDVKIGGLCPSCSLCLYNSSSRQFECSSGQGKIALLSLWSTPPVLHEKSVEADDKFFGSLRMGVHDLGKVWLQAETSSTRALSSFYVRSPCKVCVQQ